MKKPVHTHRWNPPPEVPIRTRGVYLLHGIGEHSGRYERLARRLAGEGWRVASHDHPGHGLSGGVRGRLDPPGSLVTQSAIQFMSFAAETGATPFLFGHSLGGVVATELVLMHRLPIAGLILSAPAIVPRINRLDRLKLRLMSLIAPSVTLELPYDGALLTHDANEIAAAECDPLMHGFKSAELVNWLLQSGQRAVDLAGTLDTRTLLMIAGRDLLIDTETTRRFAESVPPDLLTLYVYDDLRHELLNERPESRDGVMNDIVNWLDGLSCPMPSIE